jgi:hypothetical protein
MSDADIMPPPKPASFNFKTNADFRRMLETPRAERAHEGVCIPYFLSLRFRETSFSGQRRV